MSTRADALNRLFRDDDPSTVGLVKKELVRQGEEVLGDLRELLGADSAIVAAHAQEVLQEIAGKKASASLESMITGGGDLDWEEISILVSSALMPWVEQEDLRARLDDWGAMLKTRLDQGKGDRIAILTALMHGELGFTGNGDDYYNHENSILASVLENKKGNPLTLSLLYLFVAKRAGLVIEGVNFPGHFIARCGETFFDPFHDGRILDLADCADILARQGRELSDEHLEPPGSREVVARMLANLSHAYALEEFHWQKRMVDRWLGLITGAERANDDED
jgi:regulator of sirC expression with transglutaminase-like and TPR domain